MAPPILLAIIALAEDGPGEVLAARFVPLYMYRTEFWKRLNLPNRECLEEILVIPDYIQNQIKFACNGMKLLRTTLLTPIKNIMK